MNKKSICINAKMKKSPRKMTAKQLKLRVTIKTLKAVLVVLDRVAENAKIVRDKAEMNYGKSLDAYWMTKQKLSRALHTEKMIQGNDHLLY
jgi:hypothetical protein